IERRSIAPIRERKQIHEVLGDSALARDRDLVAREWIPPNVAGRSRKAVQNIVQCADARIGKVAGPHGGRRYGLERTCSAGSARTISAERRPEKRPVPAVVNFRNK